MALMTALLLATWLTWGFITTRPAAVAKCRAALVLSTEPAAGEIVVIMAMCALPLSDDCSSLVSLESL